MDRMFEITDAIERFECTTLHEELHNSTGSTHQEATTEPLSEEDFEASKAEAMLSAGALFNLCSVRFARGRGPIDWSGDSISYPAIGDVLAAIEQLADGEIGEDEADMEEYNPMDVPDDVFMELWGQAVADFEVHFLNCRIRQLERARFDEPEDATVNSEAVNMEPSEILAKDDASTSDEEVPTTTCVTVVPLWPSQPPSGVRNAVPEEYDETPHRFTWTTFTGESFTSDYSAAYSSPPHTRADVFIGLDRPARRTTVILQASTPQQLCETEEDDKEVPGTASSENSEAEETAYETVDVPADDAEESPSQEHDADEQRSSLAPTESLSEQGDIVNDLGMATASFLSHSFSTQGNPPDEELDSTRAHSPESTGSAAPSLNQDTSREHEDQVIAPSTQPVPTQRSAQPLTANSSLVKLITGEKKRKGEKKYRSLPNLGVSFIISLKKATTKPTIVLFLNNKTGASANEMLSSTDGALAPTHTPGESVLIVKFAMPSGVFPTLTMAEAKVELRIDSMAQMVNIALAMKNAAKENWPEAERKWKWETDDRPMHNKPMYQRIAGVEIITPPSAGEQESSIWEKLSVWIVALLQRVLHVIWRD